MDSSLTGAYSAPEPAPNANEQIPKENSPSTASRRSARAPKRPELFYQDFDKIYAAEANMKGRSGSKVQKRVSFPESCEDQKPQMMQRKSQLMFSASQAPASWEHTSEDVMQNLALWLTERFGWDKPLDGWTGKVVSMRDRKRNSVCIRQWHSPCGKIFYNRPQVATHLGITHPSWSPALLREATRNVGDAPNPSATTRTPQKPSATLSHHTASPSAQHPSATLIQKLSGTPAQHPSATLAKKVSETAAQEPLATAAQVPSATDAQPTALVLDSDPSTRNRTSGRDPKRPELFTEEFADLYAAKAELRISDRQNGEKMNCSSDTAQLQQSPKLQKRKNVSHRLPGPVHSNLSSEDLVQDLQVWLQETHGWDKPLEGWTGRVRPSCDSKAQKVYWKRIWCSPSGKWFDSKPQIAMLLGVKRQNRPSQSLRDPPNHPNDTRYAQHPPATAAQRPSAAAACKQPSATAAQRNSSGSGDARDSEIMDEAMNMLDQEGSSKVQVRMLEGGMAQLLRERPDRIMKRWQLSDGTMVLLQEVGAKNGAS